VDVSHWDGRLPWNTIRAAGMRFAIMKATQGTSFIDSLVDDHVAAARRQGLLLGAYHFFDYRVAGAPQAEHFIAIAREHGLVEDSLPLSVDVECLGSLGWAEWAETVPRLRALVNRIYVRTGRLPILYTSRHMWEQVTGSAPGFGHLPLWVACWRCSSPYLPTGWDGWRIWQIRPYRFTGVSGLIDGNVYKGTDASLERWRDRPVLAAGGADATNLTLVPILAPTKDGDEVRTQDDRGDWTAWRPRGDEIVHPLTPGDGPRTLSVQLRIDAGLEGPVFTDDILIDTVPPVVRAPRVALRMAQLTRRGAVPVDAAWSARDTGSGLATVSLAGDCADGLPALADPPVDGPARAAGALPVGACLLRVGADDRAGNTATTEDRRTTLTLLDDRDPALDHVRWRRVTARDAWETTLLRAGARSRLTVTVTGDELALVAPTGPDRGRVAITVDGRRAGVADLYAPRRDPRTLVAIVRLTGAGPHTVTLRPLADAHPDASGTRVEIDALVLLRRGTGPG